MPIAIGTPLNIATINNDTLSDLSDEHRAAVLEAAAEVHDNQWKIVGPRVRSNFERATGEGVTIVSKFQPAFTDLLRNSGQVAVDIWLDRAGDDGRKILEAYRARTAD